VNPLPTAKIRQMRYFRLGRLIRYKDFFICMQPMRAGGLRRAANLRICLGLHSRLESASQVRLPGKVRAPVARIAQCKGIYMKKFAYAAFTSAAALALAACGGSKEATEDAQAEDTEAMAEEAVAGEAPAEGAMTEEAAPAEGEAAPAAEGAAAAPAEAAPAAEAPAE
jgi:hypothetical protein